MKLQLGHTFEEIISLENLLCAWQEFIVGKKSKADVQIFSRDLMDNIVSLHLDLASGAYRHGPYESFFVNDPKRRHIHKASVRDRLLHHAVYRVLYPFFERTFIPDSYSCRIGKGTHRALCRFRQMSNQVSRNHTRTVWVLKCDIRRFFASIDHQPLLDILGAHIPDSKITRLLTEIVGSFATSPNGAIGLPLGNLTSQLFANVYMNSFDQFVKHHLKARHYIRYADDFVFFSPDKRCLENILPQIQSFLANNLKLILHPDKIFIKTLASGVDFLGWVNFPRHRVIRRATKRRMLNRVREHPMPETIQSYLGMLKWGNAVRVREVLLSYEWLFS